ncbi:hypothetical protein KJ782_05090 [Patescibacteria group bacterium]|nr:hypothetical protein [Patescibacteria group bacterium]
MVLYHVAKSDRFTFSLGPVAGFQSKEDGVVPHCGFEVRSRCQLGSFEPSFRFATRHTHKERLHHLFKVWVMRNWDSFSLGLGYQPIRKDGLNDYWNDRVAVTVKVPYKGISFFLEGRTSLREGHRTSMNFDIKIPLN